MTYLRRLLESPVILNPWNNTPLTRTPWAGTKIFEVFKQPFAPEGFCESRIGESWEFSCDPDFPSRIMNNDVSLTSLVESYPAEVLSKKALKGGVKSCEILVKLINAADALSVQVHPEDTDPYLAVNECGKPESWLILDSEPGAGIYLGFQRAVSKIELKEALLDGSRALEYLQFVPVEAGDYFEIMPGVCHAIGAGVTLLEPQRVKFGMSGKTYRMWDWGRKYNEKGELDLKSGKGRTLHIEEAMRLVDPESQVGPDWLSTIQKQPELIELSEGVSSKLYPANDYYQTQLVELLQPGILTLSAFDTYAVLVVLEGGFSFDFDSQVHEISKGMSALVPNSAWPVRLVASEPSSKCCVIYPSDALVVAQFQKHTSLP